MRPRALTAAGAIAALLVAGLGGSVRAETDIVLDNRTENSNVTTGESRFENNDSTSVGSGTDFSESSGTEVQGVATSPSQTEGLAETISPQVSLPRSTGQAPLTRSEARELQESIVEDLFVGFWTVGTSLSP